MNKHEIYFGLVPLLLLVLLCAVISLSAAAQPPAEDYFYLPGVVISLG
ncbi:hypothetical protein [Pedobacter ginsenosidimutans]|nr:hypothetical protein [Pedobacter ginsenosidimutans]